MLRLLRARAGCVSVDFREHPHNLPPSIGVHRQHVDDVGPVVASPVALAQRLR
jgi:hypothetical protein